MSQTACSYAGHFSRLRQSSGVILCCLCGVCSRARKRLSCSAAVTDSQNFATMDPPATSSCSNSLISW